MGVLSLQDVALRGIVGTSYVLALSTALSKPGFWNLSYVYARAGSKLLEVIQAKPSDLPVTSEELFSILDNASEGTFLCAGTPESVQNYVFEGEAAKIGFDSLNVIACTSFLFEHKLIKAWTADKDAEALRLKMPLFEEEEAAKKNLPTMNEEEINLEVPADKSEVPLPEASSLPAPSGELLHEKEGNLEVPTDSLKVPLPEASSLPASSEELSNDQWQVPKSKRFAQRGSHNNQNHQALKGEPIQKHKDSGGPVISNKSSTRKHETSIPEVPKEALDKKHKDSGGPVISSKSSTRKLRVESDATSMPEVPKEAIDKKQINHDLMIGSLSIPPKDCSTQSAEGRDDFGSAEPAMPKKYDTVWKPHDRARIVSKPHEAFQKGSVIWTPSRHEGGEQDPEDGVMSSKLDDQTSLDEKCLQSCASESSGSSGNYKVPVGNALQFLGLAMSAVKDFLAKSMFY